MASNTHGGRRSQIANYILITAAVLLLLAYPFWPGRPSSAAWQTGMP